jgi:hypothetical protein
VNLEVLTCSVLFETGIAGSAFAFGSGLTVAVVGDSSTLTIVSKVIHER